MILNADVLEGLAALPVGVAQAVVTSPPYFGLRSYDGVPPVVWGGDPDHEHAFSPTVIASDSGDGTTRRRDRAGGTKRGGLQPGLCVCGAWSGCLGLEPTAQLYLDHLVAVFREVRRVLRDDGTLWLNIGDSYYARANGSIGRSGLDGSTVPHAEVRRAHGLRKRMEHPTLQQGDRLGIPERLVLALQADGWIWRQTVIWAKPNPLPESVSGWRWERCRVKVAKQGFSASAGQHYPPGAGHPERNRNPDSSRTPDLRAQFEPCPGCPKCAPNDGLILRRGSWRPTTSHEYLYMLTKSASYFGDGEAVREVAEYGRRSAFRGNAYQNQRGPQANSGDFGKSASVTGRNPGAGRNPRSVWSIPTQPFPDAHFATFPERLVEPCILASTPASCCGACGAPWAPVVEVEYDNPGNRTTNGPRSIERRHLTTAGYAQRLERRSGSIDHRPTCRCSAPPARPVVLDPFAGAGTVGLVAQRLGRRLIGIERSLPYSLMAQGRIRAGTQQLTLTT